MLSVQPLALSRTVYEKLTKIVIIQSKKAQPIKSTVRIAQNILLAGGCNLYYIINE